MKRMQITGLAAAITLGLATVSVAAGETDADEGVVEAPVVEAAQMEEGESLYRKHCRFCHGTKGTSGKRLAGNEMVADADYVAHVILVGPGYMTGFAEHLTDDEVATITTYVRNSWGNAYGSMASEAVAALR